MSGDVSGDETKVNCYIHLHSSFSSILLFRPVESISSVAVRLKQEISFHGTERKRRSDENKQYDGTGEISHEILPLIN